MKLIFCCRTDNDLYRVLVDAGEEYPRFDTPEAAVAAAPAGSGVLLLADDYPARTTPLPADLAEQARRRGLRLFVEYPAALPGLEVGEPRGTVWERAVVSSDLFAPALERLRIVAVHDCHFLPVKVENPHLVVARVAGFDTAVYGLPDEVFPLLFEHPAGGLLVATTGLSRFITARYAPSEAWPAIWGAILNWAAGATAAGRPGGAGPSDPSDPSDLSDGQGRPEPAPHPTRSWVPAVAPTFGPAGPLPEGAEAHALRRGADWFLRSRLLVHPEREAEVAERGVRGEAGDTPPASAPAGDGSLGILEGYSARIRADGTQDQSLARRGDCNGESAMGLAFGGCVAGVPEASRVAANILDYWYFHSIAQQGKRADPAHPAFGLASWGITSWAWEKAFYGDDNARLLLGTAATAALLGSARWDEAMLRCLLGNLRTTGRLGFRLNRIALPALEANGWRPYFEADAVSYAPHYQAYLWACYLWAYRTTGHALFLERAESAIRRTMDVSPDEWHWTNGIAQERARMLLPLAWLVRVKDTPEHRGWLRRTTEDLLRLQDECGAIREELGAAGKGAYGPPRSNEAFGTNEATLMQENGDPLCDLLYTTNFAFIGLHEAATATGDPYYARAEDALTDFLCRIQVRSETHPELDGAWFRAFDFRRWEYWASNADAGWGAWSIETGWTQGWVTAVLGLRQMRTSLWELLAGSRMGQHLGRLEPVFFADEA